MSRALSGLHELNLPHIVLEDLDSPTLEEAEMHHLQTVRRLRPGSHLTATDGRGCWSIFRFDKSILTPVKDKAFCESPEVASEIYISITKSGKPELVTQKLTELGVGLISFFFSERSVPKWDAKKIEKNHMKLLKVSRLALAQSKGVWLPTIDIGGSFEEIIKGTDIALAHQSAMKITNQVRRIAIGPEGGWSSAELDTVNAKYSFHRSILRSETAAVAAATILESESA